VTRFAGQAACALTVVLILGRTRCSTRHRSKFFYRSWARHVDSHRRGGIVIFAPLYKKSPPDVDTQ
jgi:hypothetical protein